MFPAVLAAGIFLTALADSTRGRIACAVYTLTACLLFGVSALYHRGNWGPRANAVLRRLDHANIFLIIAGTYTPLTILLLPDGPGTALLWGVWAAALLGIAFRVFWVGAPRWLYTPCYIAMGWAAVFFLPDFMRERRHRGARLRHRRRAALQRGRRRLRHQAARIPRPVGSGSTRSSTRSRWPRSWCTTSGSRWWRTSTREERRERSHPARAVCGAPTGPPARPCGGRPR